MGAPTSSYGIITEGLCVEPITTPEECKKAALDMPGYSGGNAHHYNNIGWVPAGCVVNGGKGSRLLFNTSPNAKWTTQASVWPKACKTPESYMPTPTAAPTSSYGIITEGLCVEPITTAEECKKAALDMPGYSGGGAHHYNNIGWVPAGCVVNGGKGSRLLFNTSPNAKWTTQAS